MATRAPSLHDFFIGHPNRTQTDVAYSNLLDTRDPREARKANQIGQDIGLPGATVLADREGFSQEAQNNQWLNFLGSDPHLANFLVDPHRAASVKDDLPSLADISATLRMGDDPASTKGGLTNYMRNTRFGRTPLLSSITMQPPDRRPELSFRNAAQPNPPQFFQNKVPVAPRMPSLGEWIGGQTAGMFANIESSMAGGALFLGDAIGQGEALQKTGAYRSLVSQMQRDQDESQRIFDMTPTWVGKRAYEATQSIALMGAAILTRKPIATMGLQAGLQQYQQVRERGGSANEALVSGGVTGAAESMFEKYFGLGWMLGNFGKKATGKFIGGLLLREVPSEMATTAVQDLADAMVTGGGGWEAYKQRLPADLLNTAASTALVVGMTGGAHGIARRLSRESRAVDDIGRAAAGAQFVDQLMTLGQKSKVREEDPQTLKDFIDQRTQDSPVRNVYVPVEAAVKYMQSENYGGELDKYQDQIAQAQTTQGDVVIPIGDAVSHLSGTPAWDALKEDVRIEPGGLSRREATQQHAEIINQLEARGKEIAAEVQDREGKLDGAAEVYTEVKNRLRIAGVDDKQADAVAQIYAARYEARSERLGGTPMEQFKRSKISFPGERPGQFENAREIAQDESAVVNIGLDIPGGGKVDVDEAIRALKAQGVDVTDTQVKQSASEPTLIARLSKPLTAEQGHAVSEALKQEAIAQRGPKRGDLFGPMASKWGPFNPDYFLDFDRQLNQDARLLGWQTLSQHLTDEEKENVRESSKRKILSLVESLPHVREVAAAAVAGRAKRGWYEQSAQAILDVFGAADAPRFAALLAALSPQTSVESNLYNALKSWTLWNNEGRPTDRAKILDILGRSVQGGKGLGSVLNAWINNSVTALTQPIEGMKLSGPKVDSFMNNLVGAVDEVTNDAWMANFAGIEQRLFARDAKGGKGLGYKAMNALVRRAADILTKKTGETWTPAEVQETVWSFAKTLYEMRDSAGETRTMRQLLEAGRLTHADIANTPDFALLFAEGVFRNILEQGGYGEQIAALEGRGRPAQLAREASVTADVEGTGFTERDLQRFLGSAADRLERVRAERQAQARTLNQDVLPEAGWTPERVSGLIDQFGNEDGSSSAIAVMMSPDDYLAMNASAEGREMIAKRIAEMEQYGGSLDVKRLSDSPPIYLGVALGGENDTRPPPMVRGHDGRHRMALLKAAGVARVPVIVSLTDKDGKAVRVTEPMKVSNIIPNRSRSSQMDSGDLVGEVTGVPISFRYQDKLETMGTRVLFQSAEDVFYSALQRTVENAPQQKATAAQWKALLTPGKTPGIKTEEVEWSGVHDWLDAQQGSITKDEVLNFVRSHGITVEEVVLGDEVKPYEVKPEHGGWTVVYEDGTPVGDPYPTEEQARTAARQIAQADFSNTQFDSWSSDPGNNTYRELLITLPLGKGANPDRAPSTHWDTEGVVAHLRFMEKTDAEGKRVLFIEEVQSDWHQKGRDQGYAEAVSKEKLQELRDKQAIAVENRNNARTDFIDAVEELRREAAERGGSRSLALGSRLAIADHEGVGAASADLTAENFMQEIGEEADTDLYAKAFEAWKKRDAADLALGEAEQAVANALTPGIPEAPFKTSWPALVMKRAIRWAAEHGYDKIAWTTGAEQAQRYNLAQSTGPISVERAHEQIVRIGEGTVSGERIADTYLINTRNGNAMETIRQQYGLTYSAGSVHRESALQLTADQMREVFGSDLGNRLIKAAEEAPSYSNGASSSVTLSDAELNVGGEGMKAFYDRNLVNITNDIIKKHGAKVGPVDMTPEAAKRGALDAIGYQLDALTGMSRPRDAMGRSRVWTPEEIDNWIERIKAKVARAEEEGQPREITAIHERRVANHQQMRDLAAEWWAVARDEKKIQTNINHGFEITPQLRAAALGGFSLFQGPRGSTSFTDDGAKIIQLFSSADRSTLLHETGHIWLEELKADAVESEDAAKDWEIVKKWFADNDVPVGKDGFIPTEAHEIWARGVERYLMEGKSPSMRLASVFRTFRAWLLRIYGVVQNLQTPITPEIREVMDRLIATDDAIDEARRTNETEPLFKTAEDAGMTDAEFADYQKRVKDARDEAYDALLFKTMESIRKRKAGEQRDARAGIRAEIAETINKQPQYRLLHLLRTGKWLGEPERAAEPVKLNTGWLIDNYGEGILDQLPRGIQIWAGNGESGDAIAEMVGLGSGAEVVQTLVGMRKASDELRASGETRSMRDVLIADETDRLMAERYGDPLNDGSIEEEAIAVLNSARQGEIIASEARQLAKRKSVVGVPTPYQFAREWARRTVAAGNVRDVASRAALQRYVRATNKSAKAAEEAILAGDVDEAYRQKQAQLLNHALLAEAKAAADRVDRIVAKLKKYAGRAAMKSVDPEYMEKVHALLENYDFRERSQRSIEEQAGFQKWLEQQRAKGFEVHIPPRLENNGTPYTRVAVQELESLGDLVDSLIALGRTKQKIKLAQKERDFAEFRDNVVARIKQLPTRRLVNRRLGNAFRKEDRSPINEEERKIAAMAAELLKIETIAEELDGGPVGPMHDVLVLGATTAENLRHDLREEVLLPIAKLYHSLGRKYRAHLNERVTIPELTWYTLNEGDPRQGQQVTVTRSELLSIFLNMGNLSNLEKLSKGERWPVDVLQNVMDRELTKEDTEFAQALWDTVEKLWPRIVEVEREMSGVVPERVVNNPIDTPHGTIRGGYWPVVYDPARWQVAEDLEGETLDDMFGLKSGVATQKGHTITRTGAFGPINLNLERVLFHHVEQVVTRIAYAPYARDVLRTIRDKTIRGWIDTKLGPEYRKQVEPWLARQIHNGYAFPKAARWWDRLFRQFRINMTIAAMGFRISTGVAQTLGLTASAQRIGSYWVGVGLKRLAQHPRDAARFAYAKSPELYHRTEAVNREVAEVATKMRNRHKWWTEAQHWAMFHIGMIDRYLVSLPTWLGAYEKGRTTMNLSDEEAVAFADKSVRMSQGTGREKDMSAVQSPNSEAMRFFTMFYTPFNVMFNAQWQGARGLKKGTVRPLIAVTWWWMIASVLGDALMSGDWPDWDNFDWKDKRSVEDWFARNVFFGMWAGIPLARDAASYTERKITGKYTSDIGITPITRVAEAIEKAWNMGKNKVVDGKNPERPIKQTGDLTAIIVGVPTSQLGAVGQFAWDVGHGDQHPKSVSDWYFGLTTGKVPESKEEE